MGNDDREAGRRPRRARVPARAPPPAASRRRRPGDRSRSCARRSSRNDAARAGQARAARSAAAHRRRVRELQEAHEEGIGRGRDARARAAPEGALARVDNLERALKHAPAGRSARRRRAADGEAALAGAREVRRHALLVAGQAVRSVAARRDPAGRDDRASAGLGRAGVRLAATCSASASCARRWSPSRRRRPACRSDRICGSPWRASSGSTSAPPTPASPSSRATSRSSSRTPKARARRRRSSPSRRRASGSSARWPSARR